MIGYKLFRKRQDGSYGPLFINARQKLYRGITYCEEDHPTKGYAHRPGWHICHSVDGAPHLKLTSDRVWCKVEFDIKSVVERPSSQGGTWYLGKNLKIIEEISNV